MIFLGRACGLYPINIELRIRLNKYPLHPFYPVNVYIKIMFPEKVPLVFFWGMHHFFYLYVLQSYTIFLCDVFGFYHTEKNLMDSYFLKSI